MPCQKADAQSDKLAAVVDQTKVTEPAMVDVSWPGLGTTFQSR